MGDTKQNEVVLVKGHHRWVFSGSPSEVSAYLDKLVADPDVPIDTFDAALVRHQLAIKSKSAVMRSA